MSLRARLLAGVALIGVVLVVAAVVITQTTRANLMDQIDAQLAGAAGPGRGFDLGPMHRPGDTDEGERPTTLFVGRLTESGTIEALVVPNLTGQNTPLPQIRAAEIAEAATTGEPFTVASSDADLRYRVRVATDRRLGGVLVLALPLDGVDDAVSRLVVVEVIATGLILGLLGLVAWWVVHLGVRPVKQMTATATAIAAGDLSHRVPEAAPGTEAGDLGVALNQMLGHIEGAFAERGRSEDRLRQFVADASHELRTPVATIRGYAELYRTGALADPAELADAMRRTEQEAVRMGSLVDDLLHLARLDQGRPLDLGPVDLSAVVEDAVRDARAVDPERTITAVTDGQVAVLGDEQRLRQVVANLVGNALVHTEPGTPIEVRAAGEGDRAVLVVSDQGPGMAPEVADRAFERFFRADPARSRHQGGSGLGLAIVEATVRAHGGTTALQTAPGQGTTVRIELPLAAAAAEPTR